MSRDIKTYSVTFDGNDAVLAGPGNNDTQILRVKGTVLYARIYDEETTYGNGGKMEKHHFPLIELDETLNSPTGKDA